MVEILPSSHPAGKGDLWTDPVEGIPLPALTLSLT